MYRKCLTYINFCDIHSRRMLSSGSNLMQLMKFSYIYCANSLMSCKKNSSHQLKYLKSENSDNSCMQSFEPNKVDVHSNKLDPFSVFIIVHSMTFAKPIL